MKSEFLYSGNMTVDFGGLNNLFNPASYNNGNGSQNGSSNNNGSGNKKNPLETIFKISNGNGGNGGSGNGSQNDGSNNNSSGSKKNPLKTILKVFDGSGGNGGSGNGSQNGGGNNNGSGNKKNPLEKILGPINSGGNGSQNVQDVIDAIDQATSQQAENLGVEEFFTKYKIPIAAGFGGLVLISLLKK